MIDYLKLFKLNLELTLTSLMLAQHRQFILWSKWIHLKMAIIVVWMVRFIFIQQLNAPTIVLNALSMITVSMPTLERTRPIWIIQYFTKSDDEFLAARFSTYMEYTHINLDLNCSYSNAHCRSCECSHKWNFWWSIPFSTWFIRLSSFV